MVARSLPAVLGAGSIDGTKALRNDRHVVALALVVDGQVQLGLPVARTWPMHTGPTWGLWIAGGCHAAGGRGRPLAGTGQFRALGFSAPVGFPTVALFDLATLT
jgi:hypothetical protein